MSAIPMRYDADAFLQQLACTLGIDESDSQARAIKIEEWINSQLAQNAARTKCIHCDERGDDAVPGGGEYFTDPEREDDPITEEQMRENGSYCEDCIEWQKRARWVLLDMGDWYRKQRQSEMDDLYGTVQRFDEEWKADCNLCDLMNRYQCGDCGDGPLCAHCECSCF